MFINRGGDIIAGDGTIWEGVKDFRATRLESRVQKCLLPETQKTHCKTGIWPNFTVWRDYDRYMQKMLQKVKTIPHCTNVSHCITITITHPN